MTTIRYRDGGPPSLSNKATDVILVPIETYFPKELLKELKEGYGWTDDEMLSVGIHVDGDTVSVCTYHRGITVTFNPDEMTLVEALIKAREEAGDA